jgi:aarF domain-containing kinase
VAATLSNRTVLTSEFLRGVGLSKFEEGNIPQAVRDEVGRLLMKLTFSEIFEMGIMQSDPNPSNFTYNLKDRRLNLFDFGATHIYPKQFLEHYSNIIHASVR